MSSSNNRPTPAEQLVGKSLPNGRVVEESVPRIRNSTGGNFSASYSVRSGQGDRVFLKSMDYHRALTSDKPARELEAMTVAFNFGRRLLEKCSNRPLSRVVNVLDSAKLNPEYGSPSDVVEY